MLSKMLGPEMVKANYSPAFAAVITSCAAIITALIPPSIGLIIYGYIADVSVGRLFIGGIMPGLLIAASLMIVTWFIARRRGYLPLRDRVRRQPELGRTFRDALWALSIPVFIIVGIRYGIFTPTEAGAITVLYTILVGVFAYRSLRSADLPKVMKETALDTSSVMLMICAASAFGFYLAWERIPPQMAAWLVTLTQDPVTLLLLINVLLIVLGTAVEGTSALIILTPIFVPILAKLRHRPGPFRHRPGHQPDDRRRDAAGRPDDVHQLAGAARAHGGLHDRGAALPRRDARGADAPHPVPADHALAAEHGLRLVGRLTRRRM